MASRLPQTGILAGLVATGLAASAFAASAGTPHPVLHSDGAAVLQLAASDQDDASPAPATPEQTSSEKTDPAMTPSKPETSGDAAAAQTSATPSAETDASVEALRKAWMDTRKKMFAGKHQVMADSEDTETVNHLNWYEATGFTRPYPGEDKVRPPTDFPNRFKERHEDDDDD